MRRLLLFLLLAAGGLAALGALAGGFQGAGKDAPKPELPLVTEGPGPETSKARVHIADLPLSERGGKQPNFELQAAKLVTQMLWKNGGGTWIDPVTRERIEFPFYPSMAISVDRPVPTRDSMTGTPGGEWQGWHLTVFRDVATLTRKEAESLQASPLFRQQLVLYDVTATQGTANFPISQVGDGQHKPGVRVVIHLTKDVVIKLVPDGMTIRTSDVTIDKDAGIASGPEAIEAESAAWSLRGKGFRIEKLARRLEILEGVTVDARRLTDESEGGRDLDIGAGPFRPKTLSCRGRAVVAQHEQDDGNPVYEIALADRVHLEADDGSVMDADQVVVLATRRPPRRAGSDGPPTAEGARWKLSTMTADGNVEVTSHENANVDGRPAPVLTISTQKMTCRFDAGRFEAALLEGTTVVRYLGQLDLPGGRGRMSSIVATCRERFTYGPRSPLASEIPPCDAVLELVGKAEVEGAAQEGEEAQRLQADRLQVFLKRPGPETRRRGGKAGEASPTTGAVEDRVEMSKMRASGFVAQGGDVRITGPRLSASAREMKGFDLDKDAWRVFAAGPDVRLEVAADAMAPAIPGKAAKGSEATKDKAPSKSWGLDELLAEGAVTGALHPQAGDGSFTFTGEELVYATATGGRLHGADGHRASVARPRADGRDDLVEAPSIAFGVEGDERSLTADGGVSAVVWALPQAATASPKKGARRTIAVTSGSRIEFDGKTAAGGKTAQISVRAHDGAAVESREAGVTADRVAAHELTALLVERTGPRGPDLLGSPRTPSLPAAAGPKSSRPRLPAAGGAPAAKAARWAVTCRTLDVRFGAETGSASALGGLRRLDAQGQVDASSNGGGGPLDRQHFEGARLLVDGTTGRGELTGVSATAPARVSLGDEALPQRLVSPKVDFVLSEGALAGATFHAPVSGVFHDAGALTSPERPTRTKASSGEVERFVLQSDVGDLVIDATGAIVEGTDARPVVVTRSTRAKGATTFVKGLKLVAPKLTLVSAGGLGGGRMSLQRMIAEGANTRVELGDATKGLTTAVGTRLEYVEATSQVRLTGTDDVLVSKPGFHGKVRVLAFDARTSSPDIEGLDIILELSK